MGYKSEHTVENSGGGQNDATPKASSASARSELNKKARELSSRAVLYVTYQSFYDTSSEGDGVTRVGIVPYVSRGQDVMFALGVDDVYGELTDMGGKRHPNEELLRAAVRELYEESNGVINFKKNADAHSAIQGSPCIVNDDACAIFVDVSNLMPDDIQNNPGLTRAFNSGKTKCRLRYFENSMMYWVAKSDLVRLLSRRTINSKKQRLNKSQVAISGDDYPPSFVKMYEALYGCESHARVYEKFRTTVCARFGELVELVLR